MLNFSNFRFQNIPNCLLKNLFTVTKSSILLLFILLLFGVWRTSNRITASIEAFFNPSPSLPQADVSSLIVQKIRGVSQLTTTIFTMDVIVPTAQSRKLGHLTLGKTKLLYIARGEIRAGIDLTQLGPNDIIITQNQVKIQLPPPQIIDRKIAVEQSQVYDYDRGFLGLGPDVAPQLQTLAQQKTLDKLLSTACEQGILEDANQRAKLAIAQLLTTTGHQPVEVIATPPVAETCMISNET